jgi:hypothetical protein
LLISSSNPNRLFCLAESTNFGDYLNRYLFADRAFVADFDHTQPCFVGIGTLIDWGGICQIPERYRTNITFLGTGAAKFERKIDLSGCQGFVRGPLSADKTNLPFVADLGLLLPHKFQPSLEPSEGITIIEKPRKVRPQCRKSEDAEAIITKIANAAYLITDRLHYAVVAEAYRTPWVIFNHGKGDLAATGDKFLDFAATCRKSEFVKVERPTPEDAAQNTDFTVSRRLQDDLLEALQWI